MVHPEGAGEAGDMRLGFDRRVRLEFHGAKISSDGGLLLFRELDEVLGLHDLAGSRLCDTRTGHNRLHQLVGQLRQSVFGRLAGYEDVNDADRLAQDQVMRQIVGGRAVDHQRPVWRGRRRRPCGRRRRRERGAPGSRRRRGSGRTPSRPRPFPAAPRRTRRPASAPRGESASPTDRDDKSVWGKGKPDLRPICATKP